LPLPVFGVNGNDLLVARVRHFGGAFDGVHAADGAAFQPRGSSPSRFSAMTTFLRAEDDRHHAERRAVHVTGDAVATARDRCK